VFLPSSYSLILIQVLDAKFEAEQEETRRRRENYFKDETASKAAPKRRRPKKTAAKSQKVQSNTSDKVLKLQRRGLARHKCVYVVL
jgi:hypothetical protein